MRFKSSTAPPVRGLKSIVLPLGTSGQVAGTAASAMTMSGAKIL
jgi:hypothetical protein